MSKREITTDGKFIVCDAAMIRARRNGNPKVNGTSKYRIIGPHTTLFKTERNARRHATHYYGNTKYARPVPGLVLHFRPEDLEPLDMERDERARFYKDQIDKWRDRLLANGLSLMELQKLCEDEMLKWGELMKKYESEAQREYEVAKQ